MELIADRTKNLQELRLGDVVVFEDGDWGIVYDATFKDSNQVLFGVTTFKDHIPLVETIDELIKEIRNLAHATNVKVYSKKDYKLQLVKKINFKEE